MNHDSIAYFQKSHHELRNLLPNHNLKWLAQLRREAISKFTHTGFPLKKIHESWRQTPLHTFLKDPYQTAHPSNSSNIQPMLSDAPKVCKSIIVIQNGTLVSSTLDDKLLNTITFTTLSDQLLKDPASVQAALEHALSNSQSAFIDLNLAFLSGGIYLKVPQNTIINDPIQIAFFTDQSSSTTIRHFTNLIHLDQGSTITLLITYHSHSNTNYANNIYTQINAGPETQCNFTTLQDESPSAFHFNHEKVDLDTRSRYQHHRYDFGAKLSRSESFISTSGNHTQQIIRGLFHAKKNQHLENHLTISHHRDFGKSDIRLNGLADGQAKGVFQGKISIDAHLSKITANLINRNILLSSRAEIDTKPDLEIYSNDVSCHHGATVGQLDAEALFYLRARGLSQKLAKKLLIYGFCKEIIDACAIYELQQYILEHHLLQEA